MPSFTRGLFVGCFTLIVASVACGGTTSTESQSRPDTEATVEARVKSTVAALPTLTPLSIPTRRPTLNPTLIDPLYWPTFGAWGTVIPSHYNSNERRLVDRWFPYYAMAYIADGCISGIQLSAEGLVKSIGAFDSLGPLANEIVSKMRSYREEDVEGTCLEAYLYPDSDAQLILAIGLAEVVTLSNISADQRRFVYEGKRRRASEWYGAGWHRSEPWLLSETETTATGMERLGTPLSGRFSPPDSWVFMLELRRIKDAE